MDYTYGILNWQNHVTTKVDTYTQKQNADGTITLTPAEGEVINQGTPMNAGNFNNIETGVFCSNEYSAVLMQQILQHQRKIENLSGEIGTSQTTNTYEYPFNSSGTTISLATRRVNLNYTVETEVTEENGGFAGDMIIYDKQVNGFKVKHNGSAKAVKFKYTIRGGLS